MSLVCQRILTLVAVSLLAPLTLLAQTVTLSPSSHNFGSTPVGTGTAWFTFTLSNSGSSAVSISNVTVSGPFVVSSNCGSSVAAQRLVSNLRVFRPNYGRRGQRHADSDRQRHE